MNIVYQNNRFEVENPSDAQTLVGFGFNDTGVLWTENPLVVQKIKAAGIDTSISQLALVEYQRQMTVADSYAMDSDIYIPSPPNKKYKPFQKAGIKYAAARETCLIGDEPGLGKTIQAIGVSNYDPSIWSILVIAPAGLKRNWRREFIWWDVKGLSIGIVTGTKDEWPETDVVIINYDVLNDYRPQLRAKKWDLLVVDEAHRLKNKRTNRAMEVLGGKRWREDVIDNQKVRTLIDEATPIPATRKLFLTGTPALNGKPKELWPLVQALDPHGIGADWYTYAKTYCELREIKMINYQTHQMERVGWYWDGAENLGQLQQLLRQRIMVRRRKEDVLTDLDPKLRMVLPIEASGKLQKQSATFEQFAKEVTFDEIPKFDGFSKFLHDTGLFLVKPAIELIKDKLEERDKIVVMTYHKDVNDKIAKAFGSLALTIDGDIDPDKRQPIVDRFQTDSTKRVLVCTMMSVLEGLTMTAASLMIFVERDWVPGNIIQAEDRIHRIGQTKQAEYIHMVLENSLGERQIQTFVDKHSKNTAMVG